MKRLNPDQPAYLSFVVVCRNAASTLERCLTSLRARAPDAEVVVVDTLSDDAGLDIFLDKEKMFAALTEDERRDTHTAIKSELEALGARVLFIRLNDEPVVWIRLRDITDDRYLEFISDKHLTSYRGRTTQEIAQQYADVYREYAGPEGTWTKELSAVSDMAAARNYAHSLATGVWQCWVDADDELPDAGEVDRLLRLNGQHPAEWKSHARVETHGSLEQPVSLEEFLRKVDTKHPDIDCIQCSYLYRSDKGLANTWQKRERFVKHPQGKYQWSMAGHEFWARIDGKQAVPAENAGILFVHRKEWTLDDYVYSNQRHFNIFHEAYEKGERVPRNLWYLADQSRVICPDREESFIRENLRVSVYDFDRYQALVQLANLYARRGLYTDAVQNFAAAIELCPNLPEAFAAAASAATDANDYARAVRFYRIAIGLPVGQPACIMAPRDQLLTLRMKLALVLEKLAKGCIDRGDHASAEQHLHDAFSLAEFVHQSPMLGADLPESQAFINRRRNAWEAQKTAVNIYRQWDFLVRNDETLKAVALLSAVPHMLQDHPLVRAIETWSQKVAAHVSDPTVYRAFYENESGGKDGELVSTQEQFLTVDTELPRTQMLLGWLRAEQMRRDAASDSRPIRVIEFGTFDGVNVLPTLKAFDRVEYVAVDAQACVLAKLRARVDAEVTRPARMLTVPATHEDTDVVRDALTLNGCPYPQEFDAVVFFEVIEHVPDTVAALNRLRIWLRKDGKGRMFLSTPWGAYDNGAPIPPPPDRDPRGHVRAMTARDLRDDCAEAGLAVEELANAPYPYHVGDTMQAIVKAGGSRHRPFVFVVPSALWDWNSRHVEATGIGMSEKAIVHLARGLKRRHPSRLVQVYGPVNEPEVHQGVEYWPREQLRHAPKDAQIVVSRAPGAATHLAQFDLKPTVLWLQDAYYPDLNEKTAQDFEHIVVLTQWHKDAMFATLAKHMGQSSPMMPEGITAGTAERFSIIDNFTVPEHYFRTVKREPHHFIYASSPDRGLIRLLEIWPLILDKLPDATLDIFYGWEGCIKLAAINPLWAGRYQEMRRKYDVLRWQKGIRERGRVNHWQLAAEYQRASAWLYPCTEFHETGCTSAWEAKAAGCIPVTTRLAALAETAPSALTEFVDLEEEGFNERFASAVLRAILATDEERAAMSKEALEHNVDRAVDQWLTLLD